MWYDHRVFGDRGSGVERGRALVPAAVVGWRRLRPGALVYVGHDGQAKGRGDWCRFYWRGIVPEEEFRAREALRLNRGRMRHGPPWRPTMFHLLMRETTFNPTRLRMLRGATIAGGLVSEALEVRIRGWSDAEITDGLTETVRGPNVTRGCARVPAEARRSFTPDAFLPIDDRGVIDEDGNAEVDDVCVISVPHDILGELVCARVVPDEGAVITGDAIDVFARDAVADYTTPSS